MKATQLNGSTISKAHGVSVTSKPDCDDISRGEESAGLRVHDRSEPDWSSMQGASATQAALASRDYARTGTLAVRSSLPQLTHAPLIARRIAFQMQ